MSLNVVKGWFCESDKSVHTRPWGLTLRAILLFRLDAMPAV